MQTTAIMPPVAFDDDDEILLDEELSAEDIAAIEAEQDRWQQQEMAKGRKEFSQFKRDFVDDLAARGVDICDHLANMDVPEHSREAERIAKLAGYHTSSFSENMSRRLKERERRTSQSAATSRAADILAAQKFNDAEVQPVKVETVPPATTSPEPVATEPVDPVIMGKVLPAILDRAAKGCGYTKKAVIWELAKAKLNNRRPEHWVNKLSEQNRGDCDIRIAIAWREAEFAARVEIARRAAEVERAADARIRLSAAMKEVAAHYVELRRLPENQDAEIKRALSLAWQRQCTLTELRIGKAANDPIPADLTSWIYAAKRAADMTVIMARKDDEL